MKTLRTLGIVVIIAVLAMIVVEYMQPEYLERINYPLEYKEEIIAACDKNDLDPYLVCAIIYVESKFDPSSKSSAGAVGLMQVMPETGLWAAAKKGDNYLVEDLDNPSVSIDIGTWYYKYLVSKYKNEKLALAAYNSGFKNVDRWLGENKNKDKTVDEVIAEIPFKETRQFVERVEDAREKYREIYAEEFHNNSNISYRMLHRL